MQGREDAEGFGAAPIKRTRKDDLLKGAFLDEFRRTDHRGGKPRAAVFRKDGRDGRARGWGIGTIAELPEAFRTDG